MRLPKWLVPALLIAATAVAGGWLFSRGPRVEGDEPVGSELAATPAPTNSPAERPAPIRDREQGIVLKAQGTWQDPPSPVGVPAAENPMSPRYAPYDARADRYPERWSRDAGQRDFDRRRGTGWIDSFCPWSKPRRGWSGQRGYPPQMEQLRWPGYRDSLMGQPPFGLVAPHGPTEEASRTGFPYH
jgi:hypothetical protein